MNILEIDLTNYREHPTHKNYTVFFYDSREQAAYFESLLTTNNIWFESDSEGGEDGKFFVAIKRHEESKVLRLNNIAIGKYRNKFIPNAFLRWFLILTSIVVLTLAIVGFLRA